MLEFEVWQNCNIPCHFFSDSFLHQLYLKANYIPLCKLTTFYIHSGFVLHASLSHSGMARHFTLGQNLIFSLNKQKPTSLSCIWTALLWHYCSNFHLCILIITFNQSNFYLQKTPKNNKMDIANLLVHITILVDLKELMNTQKHKFLQPKLFLKQFLKASKMNMFINRLALLHRK